MIIHKFTNPSCLRVSTGGGLFANNLTGNSVPLEHCTIISSSKTPNVSGANLIL
jgi:hypothetical protein